MATKIKAPLLFTAPHDNETWGIKAASLWEQGRHDLDFPVQFQTRIVTPREVRQINALIEAQSDLLRRRNTLLLWLDAAKSTPDILTNVEVAHLANYAESFLETCGALDDIEHTYFAERLMEAIECSLDDSIHRRLRSWCREFFGDGDNGADVFEVIDNDFSRHRQQWIDANASRRPPSPSPEADEQRAASAAWIGNYPPAMVATVSTETLAVRA